MYENKFTRKAQEALSFAHRTACELGHNYVGTEHILLGLLLEESGVAAKFLNKNGVTYEAAYQIMGRLLGRGDALPIQIDLPLTPRSKRVIEMSFAESVRLAHNYIGTEHLLLALIKNADGVAIKILVDLGVDPQKLYKEVVTALCGDAAAAPGEKGGDKKLENLMKYGRNLNQLAQEGKLDPVIGRDGEIERLIQILSRRTKNNPCLIGEPGVGKTAVAEGLAQKIVNGDVPEILKDKLLVSLDLSAMVAGAKYRGEFEERLKKVMEEIRNSGKIILFIDEMHTIVGAGAAEGAIDASNILKPALSRGEIQVIGATTLGEYRRYVEKDAALERRFQPVLVGEPTIEETIRILSGIRDKYEAHHGIKITDGALRAAAEYSARYIPDRFLPDKAIDLIDEAGSRARLRSVTTPRDLKEIERKLAEYEKEKEQAIAVQDFEAAAKIRDAELKCKAELDGAKEKWDTETKHKNEQIDEEDIAEIIASQTKIPLSRIAQEEGERLLHMEDTIHQRVIGQDEAVRAVSKAIRRGRVGLKDPNRPIGSFIFLGPTGVGKTELSKSLAEVLFGSSDALIRVDMSEFMEPHSVSKLIGSPPGYVGYDEAGQLTEKVRRKPYSVLLFDEIEKAHPDVFNILLQILEDGMLTDSHGKKVDFKNTVIIMTSNIGARNIIDESNRLGFGVTAGTSQDESDYETIRKNVMGELKKAFRPEFLNRIDDIIVFHRLSRGDIRRIAELLIHSATERLSGRDIHVEVTEQVLDFIAEEGYQKEYGARPLRRAIQTKIEDFLAEKILENKIKPHDHIKLDAVGGQIVLAEEPVPAEV